MHKLREAVSSGVSAGKTIRVAKRLNQSHGPKDYDFLTGSRLFPMVREEIEAMIRKPQLFDFTALPQNPAQYLNSDHPCLPYRDTAWRNYCAETCHNATASGPSS